MRESVHTANIHVIHLPRNHLPYHHSLNLSIAFSILLQCIKLAVFSCKTICLNYTGCLVVFLTAILLSISSGCSSVIISSMSQLNSMLWHYPEYCYNHNDQKTHIKILSTKIKMVDIMIKAWRIDLKFVDGGVECF